VQNLKILSKGIWSYAPFSAVLLAGIYG
jgi:hypothetical protein